MITVLVVNDHPLVRIGAAALLRQQDQLDVVGVSKDLTHAAQLVEQRQPDVVLLGLQQGASATNEATRRLLARHPNVRILILAAHPARFAADTAALAGAFGYLPQTVEPGELLNAVETVAVGGTSWPT